MGAKEHILCGADPCLSPTGRGRRRPRRRVRVRRRPVDLEPRSLLTWRTPHPALSPLGRGFRKQIDVVSLKAAALLPRRLRHALARFAGRGNMAAGPPEVLRAERVSATDRCVWEGTA